MLINCIYLLFPHLSRPPAGYAHKECGADGEWFRHPENNRTWSNYTTCVNMDDLAVSTRSAIRFYTY